jgi:NAD(P)-dependent dehydrogenase (short-subunit alcohol dehydrogenase family)
MPSTWELATAPRLDGQVAVVTGANSGIGYATAQALRAKGAVVLLACRSTTKADQAADEIVAAGPGPAPLVIQLDLEDLGSVEAAIAEIRRTAERVDLLINNAGLMGPIGPGSAQRQLWANHLGHTALTAGLLGDLDDAGGRIVVVSSLMHRRGTPTVDAPLDIDAQRPMTAYGSTKLMNLLFCFEADRRLRDARSSVSIRAAHPGNTRSKLAANGMAKGRPGPLEAVTAFMGDRLGQSAERGALPSLRAALDPSIPPGAFLGPSGPFELFGAPVPVKASKQALDPVLAAALFDASLEAVGATWPS